MAPDKVCSKQPLEAAPLKSSTPKPFVPPLMGVLLHIGMALTHSWETWACENCQKRQKSKVPVTDFTIKDCRFGHYKSSTALALTIIYVVKLPIADVKSFINVIFAVLKKQL
jgi:hypothetical protein